jgi:hypothetical protein
MCVSFTNEKKTQVGWVATVGRKMWKWISANNTPPKGSSCHTNSNEMIVRSPCLEASEQYNGDGHA